MQVGLKSVVQQISII